MFNANFQTLSELCSTGKSGSFFYYTSDGNFMLKTIRRDEFKLMQKMLRPYFDHLTLINPDTLISKIYGLHKMVFHSKKKIAVKKIYFCIMNNVFNTDVKIDYRYDLKGSTLGRTTTFAPGVEKDLTIALKDLDFLENKEKFRIGASYRQKLIEILRRDADFFGEQEIIDYSLLVGVHDVDQNEVPAQLNASNLDQTFSLSELSEKQSFQEESTYLDTLIPISKKKFYEKDHGGIRSTNGDKIYFLGVIDIFTFFNSKKKVEHFLKKLKYEEMTVSCIPPKPYSNRFYDFIEEAFE
jgi:1-phosphatidylinositol-4-phosphate 5-kinase